MEAGQIMIMPVATDTGMTTGMEAGTPTADGTAASKGFEEVLAKSMLGTSVTEADGETAATDGSQEQSITPEILPQSELNILLFSQFAAMQLNPSLQQADVNSDCLSDAEAAVSSLSSAPAGKPAAVFTDSLTGENQVLKQLGSGIKSPDAESVTRQGDVSLKKQDESVAIAGFHPETTPAAVQSETAPVTVKSSMKSVQQELQPEHFHVKLATKNAAKEPAVSMDNALVEQSEEPLVHPEVKKSLDGVTSSTVSQVAAEVSQSEVTKAAVSHQNTEELSRFDRKQGHQDTAQIGVSKVLVKDGTQPERQLAAEAQPLPQEATGGTKNTALTTAQSFRFAQPTDVVVAASDTTAQKDFSSNPEQSGSQLASKLSKSLVATPEAVAPMQSAEQLTALDVADHQLMNSQIGHQKAVTPAETVVENLSTVVPEQVGRQVFERLTSHEIKQGTDQISFKLSPENLGNLQLNMRMDDQRLKLEIVAENRDVRNALLQQADELKESLSRQNIRMDSFDVTTGGNNNNPQQPRDWRQMNVEQRQLQPQYATRAANTSTSFETPVRYFAKQYQSTIDVRF